MSELAKNARDQAMSTAAIADQLVSLEESRTRSRMHAYENVAAKVRRSPSWLRNFISKGGAVSGDMERAFDALLRQHLEARFVQLQAEMEVARRSDAHPGSAHVAEILGHLEKVRALLNGGAQ